MPVVLTNNVLGKTRINCGGGVKSQEITTKNIPLLSVFNYAVHLRYENLTTQKNTLMGLFAELKLGVQFREDTWLVTQDKYIPIGEIGTMKVTDGEKIALYRPGTYKYTLYEGDFGKNGALLNNVECATVKVSMPYIGVEENIVAFAGSTSKTGSNSSPVIWDAVYFFAHMYTMLVYGATDGSKITGLHNIPVTSIYLNGVDYNNYNNLSAGRLNVTKIKDGDEIVID